MKYKIGELAKITGCQAVTIRYYEKEGLLNASERSEGNYRLYGDEDMQRLRFIRNCRQHGISLAEIRDLLKFDDGSSANCAWIGKLIQKHIVSVENKIKNLEHLKTHLEALYEKCAGNGKCGILESLKSCNECEYCRRANDRE